MAWAEGRELLEDLVLRTTPATSRWVRRRPGEMPQKSEVDFAGTLSDGNWFARAIVQRADAAS